MASIEEKQQVEINYWRRSNFESPDSESIENIINKVSDAGVFLDCLNRHRDRIFHARNVLELGGGQGWASCVYKRKFPLARVTATDISEFAVMSLPKWEQLFQVQVDNSYHCRSYDIQENDASVDLVFCFAAAHHFLAHRRTLREIYRVLSSNGIAIYFYEPVTPKWLYRMAHWRVNRKRPEVPEDVLITTKMCGIAKEVGLTLDVDYYPSTIKRGSVEMMYYTVLSRVALLRRALPCTANLLFTKSAIGESHEPQAPA